MLPYQTYDVEDFARDPYFRKWVVDPDAETALFWQAWLASHAHQEGILKRARHLVLAIGANGQTPSEETVNRMWNAIARETIAERPFSRPVLRRRIASRALRVAATALVVLAASAVYYFTAGRPAQRTLATQYGETQTVLLPDSSLVTLNANSRLMFAADWDRQVPREVWLEGEAFFEVRKKPGSGGARSRVSNGAIFTVHTTHLDVQVLGTEFNVNERRGRTKVVLNSGKIQLKMRSSGATRQLAMVPGESVVFSPAEKKLVKTKVDPGIDSAWKNKELIFDNTPLAEVAAVIEDTYGLRVVFQDSSQADRRIRGVIPGEDVEVLLSALSNSFNLKVTRFEGRILLESK